MNLSRISIVTPTFNRAKYLEETILSVISQNYPNLEYIIIDGGSTDGTIDIIKKYEKHLAYWISEKDTGMYDAIQKGFEKSTGDIMAWINSDDKYLSHTLSTVNQIFSELPEVGWIQGMPLWYNSAGNPSAINPHVKWSKFKLWLGNYQWIQQESVFWKRKTWEMAGGYINTSYKYASDLDLWYRFIQHNQLYNVGIVLGGFRSHPAQISRNYLSEYLKEASEIINSHKVPLNDKTKYIQIKTISKLKRSSMICWLNYIFQINRLLDKIETKYHQYPPDIYYDFINQKWKLR